MEKIELWINKNWMKYQNENQIKIKVQNKKLTTYPESKSKFLTPSKQFFQFQDRPP